MINKYQGITVCANGIYGILDRISKDEFGFETCYIRDENGFIHEFKKSEVVRIVRDPSIWVTEELD